MTVIWWKGGRAPEFYPVESHAFTADYLEREALAWWMIPGGDKR